MGNGMLTGFRGYAMHFAGRINILEKGVRTIIAPGLPVCGIKSANASWVLDRGEVDCKRCLALLAKHDRTAALESNSIDREDKSE